MNQNEQLNDANGQQIFPDFSIPEQSQEVTLESYDYPIVFKTLNTFFGECNGTVIGMTIYLKILINNSGCRNDRIAWNYVDN